MKTNEIETEVHTNTKESSTFRIKNNPKAYRILIDGLYSNKIESVTREIWSNALDSHVQAGIADEPFEVSFPNIFDPTFRVKDHGVGLSHSQVTNLYTTLFESTKEDSNDYVGKYGIGSKSPFAYTDSFSVTAVKDGEKNYYTAMMNSHGIPEIHHLHSEIVDEPNGVEVSFPVKKNDIYSFQNAAKRVSLAFDVKPIVTGGGGGIEWPSSYSEVLDSGIYVRMGCVIYPVDAYMIREWVSNNMDIVERYIQETKSHQFDAHEFNSFVNACNSVLTVFEIEMGEVEILPSREGLQYGPNDPTCMTIVKKMIAYYETLVPAINQTLAKCPSPLRAITLFRAYQPRNVATTFNTLFDSGFTDEEISFFETWRCYVSDINNLEWRGDNKCLKDINGVINKIDNKSCNNITTFGYYHSVINHSFTKRRECGVDKGEILEGSKKMPDLSDAKFISFSPYGKNVILIGDANPSNKVMASYHNRVIDKKGKYRKDMIKKLNHIRSNYKFEKNTNTYNRYSTRDDYVAYYQFDTSNSYLDKIEFFDALEPFVEGIDYEIIFMDDYVIPEADVATVATRTKRSITERLQNINISFVTKNYSGSSHYSYNLVDDKVRLYGYTSVDNSLLNPESKILLIPYSANSYTSGLKQVVTKYDVGTIRYNSGMVSCYNMIIDKFGLDGVVFVAISNHKPLVDFYKNHVTFDDLDMSSLYEEAKLNSIEYKKSKVEEYKFNLSHAFTQICNQKILSGISKDSTYTKYLKFAIDNVWKVCHTCDMNKISGHHYMLENLLHVNDVEMFNKIQNEIDNTNIVSNIEDTKIEFENLENLIATIYPMVVVMSKYMPAYRYEEEDFIESMIGYINMVDSKEGI